MNYKIMLRSGNPKIPDAPLVAFEREEWQRPVLNSLIEYKKKFYRVVGCNPTNNPSDVTVTYTVKNENRDHPYRAGQIILKRGYNSGVENLNALD
jgi:hypothetical protein